MNWAPNLSMAGLEQSGLRPGRLAPWHGGRCGIRARSGSGSLSRRAESAGLAGADPDRRAGRAVDDRSASNNRQVERRSRRCEPLEDRCRPGHYRGFRARPSSPASFRRRALLVGPRPFATAAVSEFHGWSPSMLPALQPVGRLLAQLGTLLAQFVVALSLLYLIPDRIRVMTRSLALGPSAILRHLATGLALAVCLAAVADPSRCFRCTCFRCHSSCLACCFASALIGAAAIDADPRAGAAPSSGLVFATARCRALALGTLIFAVTVIPVAGDLFLALTLITGAGVAVASHFGSGTLVDAGPSRGGRG